MVFNNEKNRIYPFFHIYGMQAILASFSKGRYAATNDNLFGGTLGNGRTKQHKVICGNMNKNYCQLMGYIK